MVYVTIIFIRKCKPLWCWDLALNYFLIAEISMPVSPIIFGSMAQNGEGTVHSVFQAISRLEGQVRDSEISQSRALRSVMRQLDRIVQLMAVMNRYV